MTYQIEDCRGDNRIEGGCAGEVEKPVYAAEAYGQNRCPDGKVAGGAHV